MLRNQLALTEGLKDNQKAITRGFEQFERLADMKELPQIEDFDADNQKQSDNEKSDTEPEQSTKAITFDIEKNFNKYDIYIIEKYGFKRPQDLINLNTEDLIENLEKVNLK